MSKVNPFYLFAVLLLAATVAVAIAAGGAGVTTGGARSASVHDDTGGGAAALRRYAEAMGAKTTVIEGDAFAIPSDVTVLVILGASEVITPAVATLI